MGCWVNTSQQRQNTAKHQITFLPKEQFVMQTQAENTLQEESPSVLGKALGFSHISSALCCLLFHILLSLSLGTWALCPFNWWVWLTEWQLKAHASSCTTVLTPKRRFCSGCGNTLSLRYFLCCHFWGTWLCSFPNLFTLHWFRGFCHLGNSPPLLSSFHISNWLVRASSSYFIFLWFCYCHF